MQILVTGGCGFIGSNFIHCLIEKHPDYKIVNLDKLTYAGRLENLKDIEKNPNYRFIKGDICDARIVADAMKGCDAVINFAAETHVDRSIADATAFIRTDIIGAYTLLEEALKQKIEKFVQISTDEVYGQILEGSFTENSLLMPRNPYSASKAGADRLAYSYFATYGLPVVITRSSNNFGPCQFPEKIIPLFITNLIEGKKVPVYGDGMQVRDWLYVRDNCEAIDIALHNGKNGEVYNIGGNIEMPNIELTKLLLKALGRDNSFIQHVPDRTGHDRRYSMDCSKIRNELGWKPNTEFSKALHETLEWYKKNGTWWKPLKQGADMKKAEAGNLFIKEARK